MKKKLSLIEIVLALLAFFIPHLDGMFYWVCYTLSTTISKKSITLCNLMTVQTISPGPIVYTIFNIVTISMIVYCIYSLFDENRFKNKKVCIAIPSISFILNLMMIIGAYNYEDKFEYQGETRYVGITIGLLSYIQIIILASIIVIECYKLYKCD